MDDTQVLQVNDYAKYYTWHCGDGKGKYGITNSNSIGIEICINSDGNYNTAFQNAVELTKYLMKELKNSATTKRFYATVQNKMHYAVHGHTAAELIVERANHTKEHMGLTTWADAPNGKIKKSDVTIAKNYLSQDEMKQLNRMVTTYLDLLRT